MRVRFVLFSLFLSLIATPCASQIYKYEDKDGWHFTDKPPPGAECEIVSPDCPTPERLPTDLVAYLAEKTEPHTTLEHVANGVVMIEGKGWFGTGFFVSADGHIITNRHVVRPVESWQVDEMVKLINKFKKLFRQSREELDKAAVALDEARDWLSEFRSQVEKRPNDEQALRELEGYEKLFRDAVESHREAKRNYARNKREFDNARWEAVMTTNAALSANRFAVTLADDTELTARLLSISKDWDLALLKVDGFKTPFLSAATENPHLGDNVIAVGNSKAVRTALTSGIISSLDEDFIAFDAQIMAGNSGGPIVNEQGEVLGVITLKFTDWEEIGTFGIAIPATNAKIFWDQVMNAKDRRLP